MRCCFIHCSRAAPTFSSNNAGKTSSGIGVIHARLAASFAAQYSLDCSSGLRMPLNTGRNSVLFNCSRRHSTGPRNGAEMIGHTSKRVSRENLACNGLLFALITQPQLRRTHFLFIHHALTTPRVPKRFHFVAALALSSLGAKMDEKLNS